MIVETGVLVDIEEPDKAGFGRGMVVDRGW